MIRDKPLVAVPRCSLCGRAKNQHRARTLECPKGRKTRVGYLHFGPERFVARVTTP